MGFDARRATIQARVAVGVANFFAQAAAASAERDERDWQELADLAAQPEWDRALPYGTVETACALD